LGRGSEMPSMFYYYFLSLLSQLKNLCFELGFGGYILIFINAIAKYDSMDEDPFWGGQ